jgi:hypothetical protein
MEVGTKALPTTAHLRNAGVADKSTRATARRRPEGMQVSNPAASTDFGKSIKGPKEGRYEREIE